MLSSTRRALRASLFCAIAATCALAAPSVHADPRFPPELRMALPNLTCDPPCTICHLTLAGGLGTLRSGGIGAEWLSMGFGLDIGNPASVITALNNAKSANSDADGDGMSDYLELSMGENPSDPKNLAPLCPANATKPLVYGCARVSPQGHVDDVAAAASALVVLLGIAALRRRPARTTP